MSNIIRFPTAISPKDALKEAAKEEWDEIMIIGTHKEQLKIGTSDIKRKDALWLLEKIKLDILRVHLDD